MSAIQLNPMLIRVASPYDIDDVVLLLTAQFDEHSIAYDDVVLRATACAAIEQPSRGTFLIARDAQPIGIAYLAYIWTLEHAGKTAWLEELYVVPSMRSRGVGSSLLREAITYARNDGCAAIDLEVDDDHARAANLYARAGFQRLHRSRWFTRLSDR